MNLRGTWIVYTKELKDILRDRRTIISMVLVPLLFYPVLSAGIGSVISSQIEKTRAARHRVLVLPVHGDSMMTASLAHEPQVELVPADSVRAELLQRAATDSSLSPEWAGRLFGADRLGVPDSIRLPIYYAAIAARVVRAVIELPAGLSERIGGGSDSIVICSDDTDIKSETAGHYLHDWADRLRDTLVARRLESAGMDRRVMHPFVISTVDVAPRSKRGGFVLAMMLPYMLMIFTLTGGMYPALDITAGEKERNTLETLLAAPVARWELAVGKFLTVLTAGFVTMLLATTSMTLSMKLGAMQFGSEGAEKLPMMMSLSTAGWIVLLMLPMAVLFSSVLIAVSIAARSYKEGQSYVTPLLMIVIMPAMVSFVPGIELNWTLAVVPIINLSLALKEVLLGTQHAGYIALIFVSTAIYAAFALFVTTRMFQRESVLFRT